MKQKLTKWTRLAVCIAMTLTLMVGLVPTVAMADNESTSGITFTPTTYDIAEDKLSVTINTNNESYVAYYTTNFVQSYLEGKELTASEMFERATKTKETSVTLPVSVYYYYVYVWYVDGNGNHVTTGSDEADAVFYVDDSTLVEYVDSISYKNGNTLEDYQPGFKVEKGILEWTPYTGTEINASGMDLSCYLEKDGEQIAQFCGGAGRSNDYGKEERLTSIIDENGSGTYTYYCWFEGDGIRTKPAAVSFDYTKPTAQIAGPDYVRWTNKYPETDNVVEEGIAVVAKVENAYTYRAILYSADSADSDNWTEELPGGGWTYSSSKEFYQSFGGLMLYTGKYYKAAVRAYSNDITAQSASEWVFSDVYHDEALQDVLSEAEADSVETADADALTQIFESQTDNDKKTAIASSLKDGLAALDTDTLKDAMQTSTDTLATVKAIEQMFKQTANVNVRENVSGDAKDLMGSDEITVVGAGLNADGSEVTLTVNKAAEPKTLDGNYGKSISLDITLDGASKATTGLDIPVWLTMLAPVGIDMSKLVILHYTDGSDTPEKLTAEDGYTYDATNGTISFTVTHFSTFVFAEEDTGSAETADDDGGSGTSGNSDSTVTSGTSGNSGSIAVSDTTTTDTAAADTTATDITADDVSPKTEDAGSMAAWLAATVLAGCGAVYVGRRKISGR